MCSICYSYILTKLSYIFILISVLDICMANMDKNKI